MRTPETRIDLAHRIAGIDAVPLGTDGRRGRTAPKRSESALRWLRPGTTTTTGQTALPEDLLHDQSVRVQMFYLAGAALWALTFAMDTLVAPQGSRGPHQGTFELIGLVLSGSSAVFVRWGRGSERARIDVAAMCVVLHGLLLGLLKNWVEQSTSMRPLSPNIVLISFLG